MYGSTGSHIAAIAEPTKISMVVILRQVIQGHYSSRQNTMLTLIVWSSTGWLAKLHALYNSRTKMRRTQVHTFSWIRLEARRGGNSGAFSSSTTILGGRPGLFLGVTEAFRAGLCRVLRGERLSPAALVFCPVDRDRGRGFRVRDAERERVRLGDGDACRVMKFQFRVEDIHQLSMPS